MPSFSKDFRLADFKLLLPLGQDVRLLLYKMETLDFLPHLAPDIGRIDLICNDLENERKLSNANLKNVRVINEPNGHYDAVIVQDTDYTLSIEKTADSVYIIGNSQNKIETTGHAWTFHPHFPGYRYMVPKAIEEHQEVYEDLNVFNSKWNCDHSSSITRGHPPATQYLAIQSSPTREHRTFCEQIVEKLGAYQDTALIRDLNMDHWVPYSGNLSEGSPIVLIILNREFKPWVVIKAARFRDQQEMADEYDNIQAILERCGPNGAKHVAKPILKESIDNRTLLAYRYEANVLFNKLSWYLWHSNKVFSKITQWLIDLTKETAIRLPSKEFEEKHINPLERLLARGVIPEDTIDLARKAIEDLHRFKDRAFSIVEHGDFRIANMRIADKSANYFKVIDWAGADLQGVPFGDLCNAILWERMPKYVARRHIKHYLQSVGLTYEQGTSCWLSYMARRWEQLDTFRPIIEGDRYSGGGVLLYHWEKLQKIL